MHCPICHESITRRQTWHFTSLGRRIESPCPNCGVDLILAKRPYRIMLSAFIFLLAAALIANNPHSGSDALTESDRALWLICMMLAVSTMVYGRLKIRFTAVDRAD